ncbi:MAG: hypothetical protein HY828_01500 [Actinobacteria bacterium]|nr:hypothetical protein [Actinomycetota bacterium]
MVKKHRFRIGVSTIAVSVVAAGSAIAMAINGVIKASVGGIIVAAALGMIAVWVLLLVPVVCGSRVRVGLGTVDFADGQPVDVQHLDIRVLRVLSLGTYLQITVERADSPPIAIPLARNGKPSHRPADYAALAAAMRVNPDNANAVAHVELLAAA